MTQKKLHFTLIELLVVIAIIGILASLLLPALNKARKEGKSAVCLSNFKQLNIALMLYADNNQEHYPVNVATSGGNITWDDRLANGYDGRTLTEDQINGNQPGRSTPSTSDADDRAYPMYLCPLDTIAPVGASNVNTRRTYTPNRGFPPGAINEVQHTGIIDGGSGIDSVDPGDEWSLKISKLSNPQQNIAIVEVPLENNMMGNNNKSAINARNFYNFSISSPEFWLHGNQTNQYLFGDGHAEKVVFPDTYLGVRDHTLPNSTFTMWDARTR
ncbi:MAG: type II secretion system GspH family protein [Lentisphaeria bacterium]|nr:type II secretion system GspH family protein [Lentisphaeria bacterium]